MANIRTLTYDGLIVGGGGAGLRAALQLAQSGHKTAVISKVFPTRSHTVSAQGGITCSIASSDPNDDWRCLEIKKCLLFWKRLRRKEVATVKIYRSR